MRWIVLFFILLLSVSSFGQTVSESSPKESPHQVWKVYGRQWSVEAEYEYGRWVEENIREDFFLRAKIPVDCADVPYATRWIYARIAHLPAAATTKDGKLIGHWSTQWKHLPTHPDWQKDLRFRAALLHMLSETSTRTLPLDTYPIRISPDSVTPGTAFFITESHAGIVGFVSLDGSYAHPLQTWEATVPVKLQKVTQKSFLVPRPESTTYSGLVKFRWPILENGRWRYYPVRVHPFYSDEQYRSAFYEGYGDFVQAVAKRIDPTEYDPVERADRILTTITYYLQDRIPIVLAGYRTCHQGGCPEGSDLWETYSTPGRDGMIVLMMDHLAQLIETNQLDHEEMIRRMEAIPFQISPDRSVTFYHLYQNCLWLSPHPEDSIEARWGLKKCDLILSRIRSGHRSISFIERTYRAKDPRYANFSIQQQQEVLHRLYGEWDRSECEDTEGWKKMDKR
jgi:hypothetical protein